MFPDFRLRLRANGYCNTVASITPLARGAFKALSPLPSHAPQMQAQQRYCAIEYNCTRSPPCISGSPTTSNCPQSGQGLYEMAGTTGFQSPWSSNRMVNLFYTEWLVCAFVWRASQNLILRNRCEEVRELALFGNCSFEIEGSKPREKPALQFQATRYH